MSRQAKGPRDHAVRERIASDFAHNLLVEAGAGSGKTYSLAMRMAAGIECGVYQVDGMAAVTFTRKAAAELRGRFQEALEARLQAARGPHARQRLEEALRNIERLFAGTIHSFCAHLLRERPVDARVAPGFEELGDVEDIRLRAAAWRDFIVERRADGCRAVLDLLDAGVRPKDLDEAFGIVCEHQDVTFDAGDGSAPDPAPFWPLVDRFWKDLSALKPESFDENTTCQVLQRFDEHAAWLRRIPRDRPASLAAFLKAWEKPRCTQAAWNGAGKEMKRLLDAFAATVAVPYLTWWRAYVHRLAMSVLIEGRDDYAEVRRRRNVVNYVDLLAVAARMLRESPHVRRALQAKYRWLFIDEFQDTDPIQAEIFLALASDEHGGLRPGALFVVGDPKQSIFRFRRADIDIYNHVAARIEATGGARLTLTANFRSLPGVCALTNTVFPPLFGALSAPWSPVFQPLDPVRAEKEGGEGPRVAKIVLPEAKKAAEATRAEAEAVATYVRAEVSAGRRRYGDFLILTRNKPRLGTIAAAFDALEIPVEVTGAGFFRKAPEVKALALLLAALADPLDAVSLVGVLRGRLFGLSDRELFQYVQAGGRLELNAPLPAISPDPAVSVSPVKSGSEPSVETPFGPVLPAMRQLRGLLRLTRTLPLPAAVDRILEETGWLALAATAPAGADAGRLLQAVDRVRAVVEEGGGLADAAEALAEDHEVSNESEALPLEPGLRNVVRLMNLHKAKGLEAPVVILADAGHDYQFPVVARIERTGDVARGYLRVGRMENGHFTCVGQPRDWAAHEEQEQKYMQAERLRLLYVAATRAEDLLVVCQSEKASANKAWGAFAAFLADVPDVKVKSAKAAAAKDTGDLSDAARAEATAAREAARERACAASLQVRRVTGPENAGERGTSDPPSASRPGDGQPGGAAWGSLVHGLLEHAVRHPDATSADLERLARWLTVEVPDLRVFIPRALDLVEGVRTAPFWSEVQGAEEVQVEVPFSVRLEAGEAAGAAEAAVLRTLVHGVIDLLYRTKDGWRILDYKTDRLPSYDPAYDGVVLDRHGTQLAQYRFAWERVSGEPVAGEGIVLVRGRRTVWVPPARRSNAHRS